MRHLLPGPRWRKSLCTQDESLRTRNLFNCCWGPMSHGVAYLISKRITKAHVLGREGLILLRQKPLFFRSSTGPRLCAPSQLLFEWRAVPCMLWFYFQVQTVFGPIQQLLATVIFTRLCSNFKANPHKRAWTSVTCNAKSEGAPGRR